MPLDPRDRDLAVLALASTPDGMLERLADLARSGVGTGITVVVGGLMISGNLVSAEHFAQDLDEKLDRGLQLAEQEQRVQEDVARPLRELLRTEGSMAAAVRLEREFVERTARKLDELGDEKEPDELLDRAALAAYAPPVALNLSNAAVFHGKVSLFNVDMVRVRLQNVDAWWMGLTNVGAD